MNVDVLTLGILLDMPTYLVFNRSGGHIIPHGLRHLHKMEYFPPTGHGCNKIEMLHEFY